MTSQSNAVHKIVAARTNSKADGKHADVARFPLGAICVCLLQMDPLRVAGLQAVFEDHVGIKIVVQESPLDEGNAYWLDPTVQVAVVGAKAGKTTLKLIASMRSSRPDLLILVMSPATGRDAILQVLRLGAKGFLHDTVGTEEFEEAVRVVASDCLWAPRRLQAQLIAELLSERAANVNSGHASFTHREEEVLTLLLDGSSNREIAKKMKIEERTVKAYVAKLMAKTGVKNRTALSMYAISVAGLTS